MKLAKVNDAIESVGVSVTLAKRLVVLEQDKAETERALQQVPIPVKFLPDVVLTFVRRWRELVETIESLTVSPETAVEDIVKSRTSLHALLGTV